MSLGALIPVDSDLWISFAFSQSGFRNIAAQKLLIKTNHSLLKLKLFRYSYNNFSNPTLMQTWLGKQNLTVGSNEVKKCKVPNKTTKNEIIQLFVTLYDIEKTNKLFPFVNEQSPESSLFWQLTRASKGVDWIGVFTINKKVN